MTDSLTTDEVVAREKKTSARLRAVADELDRLDPCGWEEAWWRTCAALSRGNREWSISGRAPLECMETELARLYDLEKKCKELENNLRTYRKADKNG